jgi:hypothetical protein
VITSCSRARDGWRGHRVRQRPVDVAVDHEPIGELHRGPADGEVADDVEPVAGLEVVDLPLHGRAIDHRAVRREAEIRARDIDTASTEHLPAPATLVSLRIA